MVNQHAVMYTPPPRKLCNVPMPKIPLHDKNYFRCLYYIAGMYTVKSQSKNSPTDFITGYERRQLQPLWINFEHLTVLFFLRTSYWFDLLATDFIIAFRILFWLSASNS
jgi:hypothetical protein